MEHIGQCFLLTYIPASGILRKLKVIQSLIVEGDSEVIINLINGDNMAQSEFGHILQDIKFLCSFFRFVSLRHIGR